MAKDAFYFSHDYYSRHDPKLVKLRLEIGPAGDGIFWDLCEMMYEEGGYLSIGDIPLFAKILNTSEEIMQKVIFESKLFQKNGEKFYSTSVLSRIKKINAKRRSASSSAKKRWNANAMPTQCERNAIKERKGKEIKGKKIKEWFDFFWGQYPKKAGKKTKAMEYFLKSIVDEKNIDEFDLALKNYKKMLELDDWRSPKDGQGYFNPEFWRTFIDYKPHENAKNISDFEKWQLEQGAECTQ